VCQRIRITDKIEIMFGLRFGRHHLCTSRKIFGTLDRNPLVVMPQPPVEGSLFFVGSENTLGHQVRAVRSTRGCNKIKCSPKERSTLPRRPNLQEYLSRTEDAVFAQGLSRRISSSQASEGSAEDKSALLFLRQNSKPVSKS
jgi:hypothetical protein